MRTLYLRMIITFTILSSALVISGAEETSIANTSSFTTSTVTHIEYHPYGFTKLMEIIKYVPSRHPDFDRVIQEGIYLHGVYTHKEFVGYPFRIARCSFFRIPFLEATYAYDEIFGSPGEPAPVYTKNPIDKIFQIDEPLICVFDYTIISNRAEKTQQYIKWQNIARRKRILVSPIFDLFQHSMWDNKSFHTEIFHVPIIGSFFWRRKLDEQADRWAIVDTIAGSFLKGREKDDVIRFSVLETPMIIDDITTFALWREDKEGELSSCNQLLKLPFIGPIWASWKEKDEKHWGILPQIFSRKTFKY